MLQRLEDVFHDDFLDDQVAAGHVDGLHLLLDKLPDGRLDGLPVRDHPVEVSDAHEFAAFLERQVQGAHRVMEHGAQFAGVQRFRHFVLRLEVLDGMVVELRRTVKIILE